MGDIIIIIGTESWLDSSISSNDVFPSGFTVFRKDRSKGKGGGVFILVNSKYNCEEPEKLRTDPDSELLWVKVRADLQSLYVGAFYRPPKATDPNVFKALEDSLSHIPPDALIWLGGDFNLGDIDWKNQILKPNAYLGQCCKQLLNVSQDFFLDQVVQFPTRTTIDCANTLDLSFTNTKTLVKKVELHPGISDHDTVLVETSFKPEIRTPLKRKIFQFHKANFDNLKKDILASDLLEKNESFSVQEFWTSFKELVGTLTEKHIPSKLVKDRSNNKPWITPLVKRLLRKQKKLFKKARGTDNQKHIQRYKHIKAQTQKLQRQAYWTYINSMIEPSNSKDKPASQKRFWGFLAFHPCVNKTCLCFD